MNEQDWLAERIEEHQNHLRAVAYRMLGSQSDAEDAVQETWLRLSATDTSGVENLRGWLTTVVARVCLDMLRSRRSRREEPLDTQVAEPMASPAAGTDPEHEAIMADSVGLALLVVLRTLPPAERVAFVLHDLFAVPFTEIGPIVGRSPVAARQLASRARRRVQGTPAAPDADLKRRQEVVSAFLAASRDGNFDKLLELLDPEVVLRADPVAIRSGAAEARGATAVAGNFSGRAQAAQLALIDGEAGAVWAPGGKVRVVFNFMILDGRITEIAIAADPKRLEQLDLAILDG
jgi:RNA polymerase sigma-70 factor, ECF subfamily